MLTQAILVNMFSAHNDLSQRVSQSQDFSLSPVSFSVYDVNIFKVFDQFTATMGNTFEYCLSCEKPHLELASTDESGLHPLQDLPNVDCLVSRILCFLTMYLTRFFRRKIRYQRRQNPAQNS